MLHHKNMTEKHLQISRACIRKAKTTKKRERRKFWLKQAEQQLANAKELVKVME